MKKILTFLFLFAFLFMVRINVFAQTYPIQDLGNCRDKTECFYYCQIPANQPACWSYGQYVLQKGVLADTTVSDAQWAQQHNITFPIAELGNCATKKECSNYCSQVQNRVACQSFASSHGLSKPQPVSIDKQKFAEDAKDKLGCDYPDGCRQFCEQLENHQACMDFAKSEGLASSTKTEVQPTIAPSIFDAAKSELGCDSADSCKALCSQQENQDKCMAFAKSHNLISTKKPETTPSVQPKIQLNGTKSLPCNSVSTCTVYCNENPDKCPPDVKNYLLQKTSGQTPTSSSSDLIKKIENTTGCTNSQECYQYCLDHPGVCPGFPGPKPSLSPTPYVYPTYKVNPTGYPYLPPTSTPEEIRTITPTTQVQRETTSQTTTLP